MALLAGGIAAASLAALLCVYLAGVTVPRLLIGDGVGQFYGEKREMARSIYEETADFSEDSPFVSAYRVESVERCPGARPTPNPDYLPEEARREPSLPPAASGEVRVYAIFGVPAGTRTVRCDER